MKGPEAGAAGEAPTREQRCMWGLSHGVQPVSPLPSFLQTPSFWVLHLKPQVTPVIRLPHKEYSIPP